LEEVASLFTNMSRIFRASLIIAISFGLNKLLGLARQYLIASQFGFSPELDAFNVANNMPDLIFSLFSGGALTMAFIPVFSEYLNVKGRDLSWRLFSKIATLMFLVTLAASVIVAGIAPQLVASQIGIAPGFDSQQQALVVELLRLNLIATLIFSVSGLVMASLQAHKHFLLPAVAPIFYNLGIILGAIILSPTTPIPILGFTLPAFGLGIYGLTYGVIIGAVLHLCIQIPGLMWHKFRFTFSTDTQDEGVKKILRLMGPRFLTVLLIQIMFILRDNFASRLESGAVTALTYGYFIMQVPESLIGTSVATALLPTLSSYIHNRHAAEFTRLITISVRALIVISILCTVLTFIVLTPLVEMVFNFSTANTTLLVHTTYAFMAALLTNVLLEVFVRAFYAKQNAMVPLYATLVRAVVFVILGVLFYQKSGAVGIAAIDSIAVTVEAVLLFIILSPNRAEGLSIAKTMGKSIIGSIGVIALSLLVFSVPILPVIVQIGATSLLAIAAYALFAKEELKLLIKL
jgi:putative peptidoglycan lipid II flippase